MDSSAPGGTVIMEGRASVRVIDHGEFVSVVDLDIPAGSPRGIAVRLGSSVVRIAGRRPIWIAVEDSNDSARVFFERAGFRLRYLIMEKK